MPYRDPETLRAFLKVIDTFTYDHSERLGDAFEYLLSVLGSQGDAGQFRTPRHIIDFMVAILDPKKDETVLDPACGTAGFLVSSYKHILKTNTDAEGHSTLTPDEKGKLATNFKGYDISPDMVRLSLVNLYLHGFVEPHIVEYDTLTSEERWNEYADVILANPPFMSPKGGIRPHRRFSVQSKRSEVLFVDYMAEHLTPTGRAGIIVPEGIIFQSQTSHKQLRKILVENYLVAVISLPAGVFQPYSGVKTSILILDKTLAKKADRVAFFKVENDGFGLGAQRREIAENDLPQMAQVVKEYLNTDTDMGAQAVQDKEKESCSSCSSMLQNLITKGTALIAEKERIAANGEYNLSGERYRESGARTKSKWPMVELDETFESIRNGYNVSQTERQGRFKVTRIQTIAGGTVDLCKTKWTDDDVPEDRFMQPGDILLSHINSESHLAKTAIFTQSTVPVVHGINLVCLRPKRHLIEPLFALRMMKNVYFIKKARSLAQRAVNQASIKLSDIRRITIPLPPLEVQREIVAEIEGYQRVIDGGRAVIDNYRPQIEVDPEWPLRPLGDLAQNLDSQRIPIAKASRKEGPFPYYGASGIVDHVDGYVFDEDILLISEDGANLIARSTPIAFSVSGKCWVNNHAHVLKFESLDIQKLVAAYLNSISIENFVTGSAQPKLNQQALNNIPIPMPHDSVARNQIVAELEAEQSLVNANRELIGRFEKKVQEAMARVWGEKQITPPARAGTAKASCLEGDKTIPYPESLASSFNSRRIRSPISIT